MHRAPTARVAKLEISPAFLRHFTESRPLLTRQDKRNAISAPSQEITSQVLVRLVYDASWTHHKRHHASSIHSIHSKCDASVVHKDFYSCHVGYKKKNINRVLYRSVSEPFLAIIIFNFPRPPTGARSDPVVNWRNCLFWSSPKQWIVSQKSLCAQNNHNFNQLNDFGIMVNVVVNIILKVVI